MLDSLSTGFIGIGFVRLEGVRLGVCRRRKWVIEFLKSNVLAFIRIPQSILSAYCWLLQAVCTGLVAALSL